MKIDSQLFTSGEGAKLAASTNADPTSRSSLLPVQPTRTEYLPVRVAIAEDERTLQAAIALRHAAYARHAPAIASALTRPEQADLLGEAPVFVVQSKLDGAVIGTMRVHLNDSGMLPLEKAVDLPPSLSCLRLAESLRFAVDPATSGRLATQLLLKTFYFYCLNRKVHVGVITARSPVDKIYERLGFTDLSESKTYVRMPHIGDIPHRILKQAVADVEPLWKRVNHPLYEFFFHVHHPDIEAV